MTHERHAATGLRTGGAILHALSAASAAHLHARALKVGVLPTCLHLCSALLKTYAASGRIAAARQLFDEAPRRNVPLWNTLVSAYARSGHPRSALAAASAMARRGGGGGAGARPNVVTVTSLMSACAKLRSPAPGREVHGYAARNVPALDLRALNALVHMYGRCGRLRDARAAFAGIGAGARNAVSWTAMIDACCENGRPAEALAVFEEMWLAGAEVDEAALLAVISACARLDCAAGLGDWVEACAAESGFLRRGTSACVANALIHMHGKAGRVERSCEIFDSMGAARTVVSWTAMVQALATNGHAVAALVRFTQMLREGFLPDEVTFLSAIGACVHAGLVSEGRRLFASMVEEHRIAPWMEHYGSMVELLCRAGSLAEAFQFVLAMPVPPDPAIWRALAGACRDHGDAGLARRVMDHVIAMEPHHAGNYLLASNLCAADEDWGRVVDVRLEMGARKAMSRTAGAVSSVQVNDVAGTPKVKRSGVQIRECLSLGPARDKR